MRSSETLPGKLRAQMRSYSGLAWWLPAWLLPAITAALTLTAYQSPLTFAVDVGSAHDQAYTRNFHGRATEPGRDFRWSGVYGYIALPGTGGGRPLTTTLTIDSGRSARVSVIVNGALLHDADLDAGWQIVSVTLDESAPAALSSRDTVIEVRAPEYRTPDAPNEAKGIKLDRVVVTQSPRGGLILPPYAVALTLAGALFLFYFALGRWLTGRLSPNKARQYAFWAAVLLAVCVALLLRLNRVVVASALAHSVVTIFTMIVVAWVVAWAVGKRWRVRPQVAAALGGLAALGFGLRYFGMALPQSVIIDMPWHMKWLRTLLIGDWQALYFPGGLSRVPAEWGLDLLIPKSPLFYFAVAPLSSLPVDLESAVKLVVCLLDAVLILVAYWLARGCGAGPRGALFAGAVYAFMPLAFRAFAYGILPTIFAQWLSALLLVSVAGFAYRKWTITRWVGLIALATLALLAFPTVALFTTLVLLGASLGWWLMNRGDREHGRIPVRVAVLLASGWLLAVVAYYGLYFDPVIASASAILGDAQRQRSAARWPGGPLELIGWTANYIVSVLPWLLAVAGLALAFPVMKNRIRPDARVWLVAAWMGIVPLFMVANYRVDMIGKHLFFTMLPIAVLGGLFLWHLTRRQRWGLLLSGLALVTVGWQAMVFWFERLVRASS